MIVHMHYAHNVTETAIHTYIYVYTMYIHVYVCLFIIKSFFVCLFVFLCDCISPQPEEHVSTKGDISLSLGREVTEMRKEMATSDGEMMAALDNVEEQLIGW